VATARNTEEESGSDKAQSLIQRPVTGKALPFIELHKMNAEKPPLRVPNRPPKRKKER
jgi:hypothetical protein